MNKKLNMDSFYVELPSSTPFPGNKTSDYLVKLPNIFDLSDGNWTVAMSSISYPLSFSGVDEEQSIIIHYNDNKTKIINMPKRLQYTSIKQFENVLNDTILSILFDETKVSTIRTKRQAEQIPKNRPKVQPRTQTPSVPDNRPKVKARTQAPTEIPDNRPIAQARAPAEIPDNRPIAQAQTTKTTAEVPDNRPIAQAQTHTEVPDNRPIAQRKTQTRAEDPDNRPIAQRKTQTPTEDPDNRSIAQAKAHAPAVPDNRPTAQTRTHAPAEVPDNRPKVKARTQAPSDVPPNRQVVLPRAETKEQTPILSERPQTPEQNLQSRPAVPVREQAPEETPQHRPHPAARSEQPLQDRPDPEQRPEQIVPQINEQDKQVLETSKRVSGSLLQEVEQAFDITEAYYKETSKAVHIVKTHSLSDDATLAQKFKNKILNENNILITLKNAVTIQVNKAREGKVKNSIEYGRQNVKGAKVAADRIKNAKKEMLGEDGYVKHMEKSRNRIMDYFEDFSREVGLPSRRLKDAHEEGITIALKIEKEYYEIIEIADELYTIRTQLSNIGSVDALKLIALSDPIIAIKTFATMDYDELIGLKIILVKNYDERKEEEIKTTLNKIREIRDKNYIKSARDTKEQIEKGYKELKKNVIKDVEIIVNEEQVDQWHEPDHLKKQDLIFGEESHTEGHIAKPREFEEKIETDNGDSWNIFKSNEVDTYSYRKDEIENRIKLLMENKTEIAGVKDLLRSNYQQIYFYYDQEQLQRFYIWASSSQMFKIKGVQLSRQLAYMLGFDQNNDGFIKINSFAKYSPDVTGGLHSFYVYAPNLIANTAIGNQYGPLLRVVDVDLNSNKKVEQTIYTQEFHHKILLNHIPEIRIRILSNSGRPIEFNWGECRVTLHFRRSIF